MQRKKLKRYMASILALAALICSLIISPAYAADDIKVIEAFDFTLPEGLTDARIYNNYEMFYHYFVAMGSTNVHELPDGNSNRVRSIGYGIRVACDARVEGADGTPWLRLQLDDGSTGYVKETNENYRSFRFAESMERIRKFEPVAADPFTARIHNYKNENGRAPELGNGARKDERGFPNDQSAAAYDSPVAENAVCYIPDGMICLRYESFNGMTRVYVPTFDAYYWVQDKYLPKGDALTALNQVYIVDAFNQNIIAYERNADGAWEVVGLSAISTGATYGGARITPEGDYRVVETRPKFVYDNDGDEIYDGYAMWTTRFSCGAYLHGTPVGYRYDPKEGGGMASIPNSTAEGGLTSMGVKPLSHMCVRNYTTFAKFIYDRVEPTEAMIIVIGDYYTR